MRLRFAKLLVVIRGDRVDASRLDGIGTNAPVVTNAICMK
jgi:hypothetical protein